MTATAAAYRAPYVSEILLETDGSLNDCAVSTGIMLLGDWTLGEALTRPDGKPKDVLFLREWSRAQLGPGAQDGGLTLHDMDALMRTIDPDIPQVPRYGGQALKGGQVLPSGAMLRLTWPELVALLRDGHSAALCGNPIGVKDPGSPLRSVQGSDDYPHVVHVTDGNANGAIVKDPLTRKKPGYPGVRVSWDELRQFTEAKKGGDRQFGSPTSVACAVIRVGDETQANRQRRVADRVIERKVRDLTAQKAQTALATDERDQARRELTTAQARILELEQATPPDCTAAVKAERQRVIDALVSGIDLIAVSLR
jgi:hypothetical protein